MPRAGPLPGGLEERDPGGDADVQGLDLAGERDREAVVARAADSRPQAPALGAEDERGAQGEVGRPDRGRRLALGGPDPELRPLDLLEVAGEVHHHSHRQVLDGACRRLADRRGDAGGVPLEDDDAAGAGPLGAAADGAEVVRVGDLVEADDERPLAPCDLVRVRIAIRLAERDDALVVHRPGGLVETPLGNHLEAEAGHVPKPRLRLEGPLRDEELEELALPGADDLAHRAAPVDQLPGHALGTRR